MTSATDELVERLLAAGARGYTVSGQPSAAYLMLEAADRLQALEAENARLREAPRMPPVSVIQRAWQDFLDANPDDVNSPEEYPDHALMTFDQMLGVLEAARAALEGETDGEGAGK